ncbi:DUF4863 family protein [Aquisediminimonas profunda]|uniref:4-hydroxylaminobenzoate lyase n=1 Tax=Aquisediminimonas profunda TaxID=1550733 RepID=UPI001C62FCE6|nr:DUF4863 family protein [Aquisediminimonas profunda]
MSARPQTPPEFIEHIAAVTAAIAGNPCDASLEERLNRDFPAGGAWFLKAFEMCKLGVAEGWLCGREAGGIKFGRAVKEGDATHGMSVDVVEMTDVVGPHHAHPDGEIDLVMPHDAAAQFDGCGAGWKVYGPASAHNPTVTDGKALILYLLPGGAIEFTRG